MTVCDCCGDLVDGLRQYCSECERENEEYFDDDDWEERQSEKDFETAMECKCGALGFSNGRLIMAADCVCGAL